jgi:hypothetical protein
MGGVVIQLTTTYMIYRFQQNCMNIGWNTRSPGVRRSKYGFIQLVYNGYVHGQNCR